MISVTASASTTSFNIRSESGISWSMRSASSIRCCIAAISPYRISATLANSPCLSALSASSFASSRFARPTWIASNHSFSRFQRADNSLSSFCFSLREALIAFKEAELPSFSWPAFSISSCFIRRDKCSISSGIESNSRRSLAPASSSKSIALSGN